MIVYAAWLVNIFQKDIIITIFKINKREYTFKI